MRHPWAAHIVAIILALIGLVLLVGGAWLAVLGGSVYYLLAGIVMVAAGWHLWHARLLGGWLYVALFVITALWGLAEARGNAWAMVPWLVAPLVMLVLVALAMAAIAASPRRWRLAGGGIAVAVVAVVAIFAVLGQDDATVLALPAASSQGMADPSGLATGRDWPAYGGTYANWRYSPLTAINPANVGHLQVAWQAHTGGLPRDPDFAKLYGTENTPLKLGNLLYSCTAKNVVVALDAQTGREAWRYDPQVPDAWIPYTTACRGVAAYRVPGEADGTPCALRVIEGTLDSRLIALDARTGQPCREFNGNGQQDTKIGMGPVFPGLASINSAPSIVRGVIVVGHQILDGQSRQSPSGVIQGFDARTGKLAWAWDMTHPDWTGYPPAGQTWTRGTPNMWTGSTADEKLGLVYVPLGNVADDYISTGRTPEENAYSSSIVALDATTGRPRWKFQAVVKDVWDYDFGSPPSLIDYKGTPALVIPSKQGDFFVVDRATGKSLTPIGTIRAPQGGVEPQERAPTQIESLWNTVRKPPMVEADMWGMSPIDQMLCRIQFRRADYRGYFTPPRADRHTVQYPGYNGGSDWGGVSIDPLRGVIVANYNDVPNYLKLVPRAEADRRGIKPRFASQKISPKSHSVDPQWGVPYAIDVNAGWRVPWTGLMCKRPPYGGIRAIDIATGRTLWDRPLGTARRNGPFGIPTALPLTIGTPNNGGAVTTASGLVFIAAATDDLIRAIDLRTGKTLWNAPLPAGGQATPIVYEAGGREYLAIFAGGHHFMETPAGDSVIAYALPRG
ncbi:MAG: membrane-bound PQQ-dependent dehydrogenase, glucose/quinate/shikimate family [Sphingomonadales bacterium]|nr:membrane-bound PQQ-dependent dehydrogenase, glucose/quinate/shikimate family [Sphingomonadales bacterium]